MRGRPTAFNPTFRPVFVYKIHVRDGKAVFVAEMWLVCDVAESKQRAADAQ